MTSQQARSLIGWGELVELEKSGNVTLSDLITLPELMFATDLKFSREKINNTIRRQLKELLAEQIPDQNVRRSLQAKLIKNGKLRPEILARLRERKADTRAIVEGEMSDFLPLLDEGGIYDFLQGKASETEFSNAFRRTLTNPAALGRLSSHADMQSLHEFAKFFWQQTEELGQLLSKQVENSIGIQLRVGSFDYPKLRAAMKRYVRSSEARYSIVYKLTGGQVTHQQIERMPGTRLFVDAFWEYFFEKMDRYANLNSGDFAKAVKFKRSDFADFTHLLYFPYVDIFGCDLEMRARIQRAGWTIQKVVTNDVELERAMLNFLPPS